LIRNGDAPPPYWCHHPLYNEIWGIVGGGGGGSRAPGLNHLLARTLKNKNNLPPCTPRKTSRNLYKAQCFWKTNEKATIFPS
jgi:hypothetical protein